jgi:putative endonuclease
MTNDLVRRVFEHRQKAVPGFTSKYNIARLVWFEIYEDPVSAISREKELKKWKRAWKIQLIEAENPQWLDLYESICKYLSVIPGWCASTRPGISRFRVRVFDAPRNDTRSSRRCGLEQPLGSGPRFRSNFGAGEHAGDFLAAVVGGERVDAGGDALALVERIL